ncbi:ankyrin [Zalerion maritima]|uniref:Ankyrin n=1 Tax=Zalerion maritima TaxID=339359 RepID=A0AAD5RTD4_9PEZI|nr:ankyrin [Zalerion maritima]
MLLETGLPDVNSSNGRGETPLLLATQHGGGKVEYSFYSSSFFRWQEPQLLLANHRIQANAKDRGGRTPLWRAQGKKHTIVAMVLIEKGATGGFYGSIDEMLIDSYDEADSDDDTLSWDPD